MKKQEFIDLFVEELEIEDVVLTEDTKLDSLAEWDSMGIMITIGLLSRNCSIKVTNLELKDAKFVGDILSIAQLI